MKKKISIVALALMTTGIASFTGCARPGELGYTPAYTTQERYNAIARNWDNEGKMTQDDIDEFLLLRPGSKLSYWNLR
jgi:hypothetical protein